MRRFMLSESPALNLVHTCTLPGRYPVALQTYYTAGYNRSRKIAYTIVQKPGVLPDTAGMFRNLTYRFCPAVFIGITIL
jgi:hypothetical protein